MEIVSLNCNSCGAPLRVTAGTNYVTCTHCGARLAVKRSGNSAYTEILEKLDQKTDAIAAQLEEITRQNEVERIDREWEQEREQYLTHHKDGTRSEPNAIGGLVMAVIAVGFGIFWMFTASKIAGPMGLFGLVFIGFGFYALVANTKSAEGYARAKERYRRRRQKALAGEQEDPQDPR
jgi:DNA-directed RNA polymerase subunit RPC12/RpoP